MDDLALLERYFSQIYRFFILNKLLKGSSSPNMPDTSIDSHVFKYPMKKVKKNKKEKKETSITSEVPVNIKVQPVPSITSTPSTSSTVSSDATVQKTKAKKDKNNKTKQMTKQNTNESLQSIEDNKEIDEPKECPFQGVIETFTASKPKKQRKPKKVTKDVSLSEDISIQAVRKVIDVEIKPKDNKEKRSKAEKKKLAANCTNIDDKSQV